VGRSWGRYAIYVGGGRCGERLNFLYRDDVPQDELPPRLTELFSLYKTLRQDAEGLGDCFERLRQSGRLPQT
jgi:sulfite reductase beta subunit-like hemoprotein